MTTEKLYDVDLKDTLGLLWGDMSAYLCTRKGVIYWADAFRDNFNFDGTESHPRHQALTKIMFDHIDDFDRAVATLAVFKVFVEPTMLTACPHHGDINEMVKRG